MQQHDIDVAIQGFRLVRRGFEARFRDGKVGETGGRDEAFRMRHVTGIEITAFESDVRIGGGEQRQAETLAETKLQHAPRPKRTARRPAVDQRSEGQMRRCGLRIKAGGVADVGDIAVGPEGAGHVPFVLDAQSSATAILAGEMAGPNRRAGYDSRVTIRKHDRDARTSVAFVPTKVEDDLHRRRSRQRTRPSRRADHPLPKKINEPMKIPLCSRGRNRKLSAIVSATLDVHLVMSSWE